MSIKVDVAYVVQSADGRVVKVGVSGNPKIRVNGIKQSVPFDVRLVALIADGKDSEQRMKALLAPWKIQGEWFAPRVELNEFLAEKRRENKILSVAKVDHDYCETFIKPAVLEYLVGRQPTMSEPGDLVYRFLREGLPVVDGRMDKLHVAVKREIPASLLAGFIPLSHDQPTPSVKLSGDQVDDTERRMTAPLGNASTTQVRP